MKKAYLAVFFLFPSFFLYSQKDIEHIRFHMQQNLPAGWSLAQRNDSVLCFNKKVHWQNKIDPEPETYGYNDTMSFFVRIHAYQDETKRAAYILTLDSIKKKMEALNDQRMALNDTIYKGKKGFYRWVHAYNLLKSEQLNNEYTHFNGCSITYFYYYISDIRITYAEEIDKEVEVIKKRLVQYLKQD